jgi:RalA-binding protein 1
MIIGLQKDLERSLKDKDRYRKKLKDYTNRVPPLPSAPQRSDTADSVVQRDESQSPAPSEIHDDSTKASTVFKAAEHKASPLTQETSAAQLIPESQLASSPSHSDVHTASNPVSSVNSPTDYSVKPPETTGRGLGLNALVDEKPLSKEEAREPVGVQTSSPRTTAPATHPEGQLSAPALSFTQATPVLGGDGFEAPPAKPAHPLRKAPPAPLNLSNPGRPSAHLHQVAAGEQDESDYNDTLEVDEIPIVERGRRKTREDDDRVREAIALKEEARSKSKKQKSESKGKSKTSSAVASPSNEQDQAAAAPLSPRQFSPLQSGLPLSPRHPPANSLNALLSPTTSESSTLAQRSIGSPPLMSPGLPTSPRPGDRPLGSPLPRHPKQTLASPPMSPRSGANGVSQPLSRPPRQAVPLPPSTPQSYMSPNVTHPEPPAQPKQQSSDLLKLPNAQPSPDMDTSIASGELSTEHVYRGLVSDQYPGLLLPPNALPSIEVKVSSSRLRPSRLSYLAPKPQEEDPVFHLAIYARSDGKQLWRMEKTIMALPALDAQLKSSSDFNGKLPDRALFSGHAPAKIDARRAALNHYFDTILETPLSEKAALVVCDFFSTDVIGAQNGNALAPEPIAPQTTPALKGKTRKEGYLTKRGKNFGGWKARYFVLDGPEFRYYEMTGGAHLGTIKLYSAQIGKQSQQQSNQSPQRRDDSEDNQYRHAFLILEPKRKDSTSLVRHVLCAESDDERDAWVEALLQHVDYHEEASPVEAQPPNATRPTVLTKTPRENHNKDAPHARRKDSTPDSEKPNQLQGLSYDDTIAAEAPIRGPTHREAREAHAHSPKNSSFSSESSRNHPSISGPSNGAPIQNLESWGNKTLTAPTPIKDKKRSIFGFSSRGRGSEMPTELFSGQQHQSLERTTLQNRNVFGIPLVEAVECTQPMGLRDPLPSVVYRSLEYLRAKNASSEEGIFRLSGSNIVIRGLRERFNTEGDVKLLDGQYYDIHAVASLLKLYLRELPASILTRELHLDFLKVLGKSSVEFVVYPANSVDRHGRALKEDTVL